MKENTEEEQQQGDESEHIDVDVNTSQAKYGRQSTNTATESEQNTSDSKQQNNTTCPECGGTIIEHSDTQEQLCEECGLVYDADVIDPGPEWRAYTTEERNKKERTGAPLTDLFHDRGLSTNIDWKDKDAHGRQISANKRSQMRRLRKWDHRAKRDAADKNIQYANGEIRRMGSALGIPKNALETAAGIYREAHKNDLLPGRSTEEVASAALYISLRIHNKPRSVDEITKVSRSTRKRIQRTYRYVCEELTIGLEPSLPTEYLPRFATNMQVPTPIEQTAKELLETVQGTHHVSGNDPTVLAAAALYAASILHGKLLTQVAIKEECDVTEVSIRNNYDLFLTESDKTPISQEDLNFITGPIDLAKKIHGDISYLKNQDNTDTDKLPVVHDDDTGVLTFSEIDEELYDCSVCGEHFVKLNNLTNHRSTAHTDEETSNKYPKTEYNFKCPFCPRITDTYIGLNTHIGHLHDDASQNKTYSRESCAVDQQTYPTRTADKKPEDGLTCMYCNDRFTTHIALVVHQQENHNGNYNSNNNILQTEYTTENQYRVADVRFACPRCGQIFDTYNKLTIHTQRRHDNYECPPPEEVGTTAENIPAISATQIDDFRTHDGPPVRSPITTFNPKYITQKSDTASTHGTNPENIDDTDYSTPNTAVLTTTDVTIGDTDTEPLTNQQAYDVSKQIKTELNRIDCDIHAGTRHLTATLVSVGGTNIGGYEQRNIATPVAAALYAAAQIMEPITGETYTQQEISNATGVSKALISETYSQYLQVYTEIVNHCEFDSAL